MPQSGFTPVQTYSSSTPGNVPLAANLTNTTQGAELAINTADGKLFYKDSSGVVQTIASKGTGTIGGSTTQVQYNNAGAFAGSANFVWDNANGRLGINNSSPAYFLSVTGSTDVVGIQGTAGNAFYRATTASSTGDWSFGVDDSVSVGTGSNSYIIYDRKNTAYRFVISSAGKVGIGTITPAQLLTISGNSSPALLITSTGSSVNTLVYSDNTNGYAGTGSSHPFILKTVDTERMRIDTNGNLLVGTTSNANGSRAIIYAGASQDYLTLDGATSSNAFMRLKYNGTGYGAIGFGSGVITGGANTDLGLSATAGNMLFATNGTTERMRIDSSGNVGIGNTSPIYPLTVGGTSLRGVINVLATSSTTPILLLNNTNTTGGHNWALYSGSSAAANFDISDITAGASRLTIDSSGNVGIGVTPNAQSIGGPALQFYGGLQICGNTSRSYINANAYWNGSSWIRIAALPACQQVNDQNSGTFTWSSTVTGAAGSAIGWTGILSIGKDVTVALQGANLNSGTGISFPATQSASSDANTLDDYEEGTWTPTDVSGAGLTYTTAFAQYTKIGKQVTITYQITFPTTASGSNAKIGGLPFTNATPNVPGSTLSSNVNAQKSITYDTFLYMFPLNSTSSSTNVSLTGTAIYGQSTYLTST